MEDLGELDRVFAAVDEEVTRNEAEDAVVHGGLSIEALDGVLNVAERAELVNDAGDTLELLTLEGQHGFLSVQLLQVLKQEKA